MGLTAKNHQQTAHLRSLLIGIKSDEMAIGHLGGNLRITSVFVEGKSFIDSHK